MGGKAARAGVETTVQLRAMLDEVVVERDAAKDRLARLETSLEERERGFDEQLKTLSEAKELLSAQFGEISQKLLGEAQQAFLQRADERFHQAGEKTMEFDTYRALSQMQLPAMASMPSRPTV
jgi:DNA recombination protein RmuC